ncbi:hypothetical protein FQN54_008912 [Arachnomyces sp. PD_36]|nr:hypothetical protein FQN54_008912 [Arachnomyces sp. PD_36]
MATSDLEGAVSTPEPLSEGKPGPRNGAKILFGRIKHRPISFCPWKRASKDEDQGIRGPIGLHLVHQSAKPLVDLIFVHGLRGGSIKTWRRGDNKRNFWPQSWLPTTPGLENVNIHTFGYDSDWASLRSSILDVHDFGLGLLEEMRNAPHLRDSGEVGLCSILSMQQGNEGSRKTSGQLYWLDTLWEVLFSRKLTYILAQDVSDFKNRIRAVFFLATPHRGSQYGATLNNILNASASGLMSSRHYNSDITTGSISMQAINDDFRKHAQDLPIFSFFEALKTRL